MMTTVHVDLREPDFATPVRGALLFTPTRRVVEDTFIVLPRPFSVTLAGVAVDVEVQPTGASWVWTVHEQTTGGTTRYVADPTTFAPVPEPAVAAWLDDATTALIVDSASATAVAVDAKIATVALTEDPTDEGTYLIGAV